MLLIREETPRGVGQVRMINVAVFEPPDEGFMIRILEPAAMVPAVGVARYRVEFDAAVWSQSGRTIGIGDPACSPRSLQAVLLRLATRQA